MSNNFVSYIFDDFEGGFTLKSFSSDPPRNHIEVVETHQCYLKHFDSCYNDNLKS